MTEVLIYGIVGDDWDGLDARTLRPMITEGDDDLDIRINSPGGYVMEGLAIYNTITGERAKGRKVTVHIDGLAASMASVIAMAGDSIIIADNAMMMIHNPWDCACGDAAELRRAADKLDRVRDQLVGIYSGQTGLDADALIPMLDAETWMTAEEALDRGFVTEIAPALQMAAWNVKAFGFRKVPDSPLISAMAMGPNRAAVPAPQTKEAIMDLYKTRAALVAAIAKFQKDGGTQDEIDRIAASAVALDALDALPPTGALAASQPLIVAAKTLADEPKPLTVQDVQAAATEAVTTERSRAAGIRTAVARARLPAEFADTLVNDGTSIDAARAKILDKLAEESDAQNIGHNGPLRVDQNSNRGVAAVQRLRGKHPALPANG
jgi:ATP-dependent Clp endopeptidase proteolytic subunit ClpP